MNKFSEAIESAHDIEFENFKFDEPDFHAFVVTEENFLDHLRVQAAGLAYYSTLAKQAERECNELEERFKARYSEMHARCYSVNVKSSQKFTMKDVDSFVQVEYESELEKWNEALKEAREKRDATASYYEGWKQKGFVLNSMTSLVTAGLLGPKMGISEDDLTKMAEKRMNAATAGNILASHKQFQN